MKNNWNLSDKMESNSPELVEEYDLNNDEIDWFYKKDVKEFIQLLKETIYSRGDIGLQFCDKTCEIIDKLAGDKLIAKEMKE